MPEIATTLYERLYPNEEDEEPVVESNVSSEPESKSRDQEVAELLSTTPRTKKKLTTLEMIKKDMNYFDGGGELSGRLLKLKGALASCQPTSVEVERAFSTSGLVVTRFRTRLNDDMINAICFLRSCLMNDTKYK